jgi:hypothetical protein
MEGCIGDIKSKDVVKKHKEKEQDEIDALTRTTYINKARMKYE